MWVLFTQDFDFTPARLPTVTVAYLAGMRRRVTRECAARAILKGKARPTVNPRFADDDRGRSEMEGEVRQAG